MYSDETNWPTTILAACSATFIVILVICLLCFGIPKWNVWRAGLSGEASLKKAEQEKLIMIETAKAEKEAAEYEAEAIRIMGEAAKKYPEYRQQKFIGAFSEALEKGNIDQIIYVPTEASIPILETQRLAQ